MIDLLSLYAMIKPQSDPNAYTQYDLIIGATSTAHNLNEGVWILNLISSQVLTKGDKFLEQRGDIFFEIQRSIISTTYQLDFYKAFDNTSDTSFLVQTEAIKMREWLNGIEFAQYLKGVGGEILPAIGGISFTSELSDTKSMLSRASFDFEIVSYQNVEKQVAVAEDAKLKGVIICKNS